MIIGLRFENLLTFQAKDKSIGGVKQKNNLKKECNFLSLFYVTLSQKIE